MNKILFATLAASSALIATPALAQSASGTVDVTGTVEAKCTASTPIGGSIVLNELAQADGTVDSAFSDNTNLSLSFTIRCTSADPGLSVDAEPLVNGAIGTPAAGYTDTVHYTATLTALRAGGGSSTPVVHQSQNAGTPSTGAVGDRLANLTDNVTVAVSNGNTTVGTDLLEAGSYAGEINIIISPS